MTISAPLPAASLWYVTGLRRIAAAVTSAADWLERARHAGDRAQWQAEERLEEMRRRIYARYY